MNVVAVLLIYVPAVAVVTVAAVAVVNVAVVTVINVAAAALMTDQLSTRVGFKKENQKLFLKLYLILTLSPTPGTWTFGLPNHALCRVSSVLFSELADVTCHIGSIGNLFET